MNNNEKSNTVFDQNGVTVTKVPAGRLSERKTTYTVQGGGKVSGGWFRKADAIAEATRRSNLI